MAILRTTALILRHSPDREHDRVLTVLTPEHGQMRLRARGSKKSTSKLGGSLEPLTEVDLTIAEGRTVDQVIGSVIRRNFTTLRQDVISLVAAQWFLELIERVTKPGQAAPELYELVTSSLAGLAEEQAWPAGRRWLGLYRRAWEILSHEGFAPSLYSCAICHRVLTADDVHYHPGYGFIHAAEADATAWLVPTETYLYLTTNQTQVAERQTWVQLHRLLEQIMFRTLERPLASDRVLRAVMRTSTLSIG